jgi:hypothetical protein
VRVGIDGVVMDSPALTISAESYNQLAPAVCAGIPGQVLVAYSSFTHAPLYGSNRIWASFFGAASGVRSPETDFESSLQVEVSPNPFAGTTLLRFSLPETQRVAVTVYDVRGRLISSVFDGIEEAGMHEAVWKDTGPDGRRATPGIYFCRVATAGTAETMKMILLE